jgi:hypothetical protein
MCVTARSKKLKPGSHNRNDDMAHYLPIDGSCDRGISAAHGVTKKLEEAVSAAPSPVPASAAIVQAPITVLSPHVESASRSRDGALRAAQVTPVKPHSSRAQAASVGTSFSQRQ